MLKWLLLPLLFLSPVSALAIVNIESMDLNADQEGYSGRVGVAVQNTSGNVRKQTYDLEGIVLRKQDAHVSFIASNYTYGKVGTVRNTNKSFLHLRHRYLLDATWSVEGFTQYQRDEFARLSSRTLFGGGVRYDATLSKKSFFHAGVGSFYERERLSVQVNATDVLQTNVWRANMYMAWKETLAEHVKAYQVVYYQPRFNDVQDMRLSANASLAVAITEAVGLRVSVDVAKDSRPPQGVKTTDVTQKLSLDYRF